MQAAMLLFTQIYFWTGATYSMILIYEVMAAQRKEGLLSGIGRFAADPTDT
jgi:hypothetical protein